MTHTIGDVVCRSQTDDGTTGNDIKLISFADEEPAGGLSIPIVYRYRRMMGMVCLLLVAGGLLLWL